MIAVIALHCTGTVWQKDITPYKYDLLARSRSLGNTRSALSAELFLGAHTILVDQY